VIPSGGEVQLTPTTDSRDDAAAAWLTGSSEGVIAKVANAVYTPGERTGMVKIKRVRTADTVVMAFRLGKEEGTVGSLILGLYDDDGGLHVVGHTSGFKAKEKRELLGFLEPYRTWERGAGEPSRWKSDEELVWEGLRPELVCEIAFDHITGNRIRHGAKFQRWREDKEPHECTMEQLRA
jgi:ATP-dependent DNA ligase